MATKDVVDQMDTELARMPEVVVVVVVVVAAAEDYEQVIAGDELGLAVVGAAAEL